MLIARVVHCPVFGGKVASFDGSKSKAVPGVNGMCGCKSGLAVAVVADNTWAATQGLRALEVNWDEGPNARLSSEEIRKRFAEAAEKPGAVSRNDGDFAKAMSSGAKTMEAVYEVPYLAHAPMEPMNCTADARGDGCDVWVSTQSQTKVAEVAAQIMGLPVKPRFRSTRSSIRRRIWPSAAAKRMTIADAVEVSKTDRSAPVESHLDA